MPNLSLPGSKLVCTQVVEGVEATWLEARALCVYILNIILGGDIYTERHIHIISVYIEFSQVNTFKYPAPRSRINIIGSPEDLSSHLTPSSNQYPAF